MTKRITVRIDDELERKLIERARAAGVSQSEALREAIRSWAEADLEMEDLSYGERLRRSGLIGCLDDAPADLSANPRHMEGFGE
ncbi:MAG: CopG family transcriptional regulator [Acidobacteria bacterium]|nr:CopG family transcriptional regulator [Acidobacteriota bacterium]